MDQEVRGSPEGTPCGEVPSAPLLKAVGGRLFCFESGKFVHKFVPVCEWKAQLSERSEGSGRSGVLPKGLLAEKSPQLHIKAVGRRLFCFVSGKFARSFLPVCDWEAQLRERPEESGRSGGLPKGLLAEKSPQLHF